MRITLLNSSKFDNNATSASDHSSERRNVPFPSAAPTGQMYANKKAARTTQVRGVLIRKVSITRLTERWKHCICYYCC